MKNCKGENPDIVDRQTPKVYADRSIGNTRESGKQGKDALQQMKESSSAEKMKRSGNKS